MKIFISYSVADVQHVQYIAGALKLIAEKVFWWDGSKQLGKEAWPSINEWIDQSDPVLVLITDNTVARAMSVGQEVGRAKAKNKTIIPLVTKDIKDSQLGFLSNIIYEKFDPQNPAPALLNVLQTLQTMKTEASTADQQKQQQAIQNAIILGGIIAFFYVLSKTAKP